MNSPTTSLRAEGDGGANAYSEWVVTGLLRNLAMGFLVCGLAGCGERASDLGPSADGPPDTLRLEASGRIGSLEGPDDALTRVGQVLIGPRERLYVSQPSDHGILVFGPGGERVGTIGGPGEGPGEFAGLHTIGLLADTLWAFDYGGPRLSFFSLAGEYLGSRPWMTGTFSIGETTYVLRIPLEIALLEEGGAINLPGLMIRGSPPAPGITSEVIRNPLLRVGSDLEVRDTLIWTLAEGTNVGISREGSVSFFTVPFQDAPLHALMPGGQGVAAVQRRLPGSPDGAAFRLTLLSAQGDTVFSRSVRYRPLPMTEEVVAMLVQDTHTYPPRDRGGLSNREIRERLIQEDLVPEYRVPVTHLAGTQDGSIWVRREEMGGGPVVWERFGSDGTIRGRYLLPADQRVLAARGNLLVTLELDELDVPYLVSYRMPS